MMYLNHKYLQFKFNLDYQTMETQRSFYDRKMKLLEKFRNKFYKILHDLKWHFPEGNCQKSFLAIFNEFN